MKPLLVVGSSGHAGVALEAIELGQEYQVIGLLDSFEAPGAPKHSYQVCGRVEEAAALSESLHCRCFFIAVGDNFARWQIASELSATIPGITFATLIHPSVLVSKSARIGAGTLVAANSVISVNASLGEGCIVNVASAVNHDCRMDDYASISGNVHLGGNTTIGFRSSVGIGTTIREKVTIGPDSVVAAGSMVRHNLPANVVASGVPAKIIRRRGQAEKYMR